MNQVIHNLWKCLFHSINNFISLGVHTIEVTYENIPVPGSPFRINAIPGCDPLRVRAYGSGLEYAITNEPATFTVETKGAGQGSLGLAIEGPSEAKMVCKENQDGTCMMEYLPVGFQNKRIQLNLYI